jgi:hypothetical protein
MSMLRLELVLSLTGRLDEQQLADVCANLVLTRRGAADDPVGTELGRGSRNNPRLLTVTEVIYTLARTGPSEWSLTVEAIPGKYVGIWRCFAEIGCRAAGLTITDRRDGPPLRTLTRRERMIVAEEARETLAELKRHLHGTPEPDLDPEPAVPTWDQIIREPRTPPPPRVPVPARERLEISELMELTGKLRTLVWSWHCLDINYLDHFDWELLKFFEEGTILETHMGLPHAVLSHYNREVAFMDIPVANVAEDGDPGRRDDIFTEMVTALIDEFGTPESRTEYPYPQTDWVVDDGYCLSLIGESPMVRVVFKRLPAWTEEAIPW